MLPRFAVCSLVAVCLLGPVGAFADEEPLPHPRREELSPTGRVDALVERVRIEQGKVNSLRADFVQRKESSMLAAPLESRGGFTYLAPDRVRWEFLSPDPISILIREQEMITWYRDIERAELVSIGQQSRKVLEYLGASSSLDELLEYFLVTLTVPEDETEPYVFDLAPKFDKVAKRIRGMTIWVDPVHFLPRRLRYVEADGDVTDLEFENLEINAEMPADHFELEIPASVDVRQVELETANGSP